MSEKLAQVTDAVSGKKKKKVNQFGDEVDEERPVSNEEWIRVWEEGKIKFHVPRVHPTLEKFLANLTLGKPAPLRFFLPMCGKSVDLKWLAESGHIVMGVDIAEVGCQQFFHENHIDHKVEPLAGINGKLYKSTDSKLDIAIFCCDFFDLTRYAPKMISLMNKNTRYLLCTFFFESEHFAGPPFAAKEEEVRSLFDELSNIDQVGSREIMSDWIRSWGLEWFHELTYLLTRA